VKAYESRVRAKWLSFSRFISLVLLSFFLSQPLFAQAQQAGVTTPSDQNEKIPSGSYQLTCVGFDARGNDLRAVCEARSGDWIETELQKRGHKTSRPMIPLGSGQIIWMDRERGSLVAGSDCRKDGSAAGF